MTSTPQSTDTGRMPELDSLRGLAAMTVVLHHFALMWPGWHDDIDWPVWHGVHVGLLYPLHAGHEAVMLFFALSGLVLALPYVRGRAQAYPVFLLRRVLRIYGPYVAALALCVSGAAVWHGSFALMGWPAAFWSRPVSLRLVVDHVAFLGVYDWEQYNFVIWSLIYEMRISLLFPALLLLVLRVRPVVAMGLGLCGSVAAVVVEHFSGRDSAAYNLTLTLHYVGFFVVGILLARYLSRVGSWYGGLRTPTRMMLFVLAFVAYNFCYRWAFRSGTFSKEVIADWGVVLGAAGFIVTGLRSQRARQLLNARAPRFFGRISYSLYLIHAPVLLALTATIHGRLTAWQQFPLYVAASFGGAFLFCAAVEEPFIRLGRRVGRRMAEPAISLR